MEKRLLKSKEGLKSYIVHKRFEVELLKAGHLDEMFTNFPVPRATLIQQAEDKIVEAEKLLGELGDRDE